MLHGIAPQLAGKAELSRRRGAARLFDRFSHDRRIDDEGQKLLAKLWPQALELLVEIARSLLVEGFLLRLRIAHAAQFLAVAIDEFILDDMRGLDFRRF